MRQGPFDRDKTLHRRLNDRLITTQWCKGPTQLTINDPQYRAPGKQLGDPPRDVAQFPFQQSEADAGSINNNARGKRPFGHS
jgi:hypothetical protein